MPKLYTETGLFPGVYEEGKAGAPPTFSGIHQVANVKNANGRKYPLSLFENLLRNPAFQTKLKERRLVGMLGHPADGVVQPDKISHVTTELKILSGQATVEGGVPIWARSEILPTPSGNVLKALFESRVRLGTSSRGWGDSVTEANGDTVLLDDFDMAGWDMVVEPSVESAFPIPDFLESLDRLGKRMEESLQRFEEGRDAVLAGELEQYAEILNTLSSAPACQSLVISAGGRAKITEMSSRVQEALHSECSCRHSSIHPKSTRTAPSGSEGALEEDKDMPASTEGLDLTKITGTVEEVKNLLGVQLTQEKQKSARFARLLEQRTTQLQESNRRLRAATQLVERLTARVKTENKQLDAAKRLTGAALDRIKEEQRSGVGLKRRVRAAEQLVAAGVTRVASDTKTRLREHVAELANRLPERSRQEAINVLGKARSLQEANNLFRSLKRLGGAALLEDDAAVFEAALGRGRTRGRRVVTEEAPRATGNEILDATKGLQFHFEQRAKKERGAAVQG